MAILNKDGKSIANFTQKFITFNSLSEYTTWVGTLSNPTDIRFFAIIKTYTDQPTLTVNDREYNFDAFRGFLKDFTATFKYLKNETIVQGGQIYRAKADFTSTSVFSPVNWELVSGFTTIIHDFTATTPYAKDEIIYHIKDIYRCKIGFTSGAAFDAKDWDIVSKSLTTIPDFTPSYLYMKYEVIDHNAVLYRAIAQFTSSLAFDAANWEAISSAPEVFAYSSTVPFPKGVIVIKDGNSYYTLKAVTAGTLITDKLSFQRIGMSIDEMNLVAWTALSVKPSLAIITDSIYDI